MAPRENPEVIAQILATTVRVMDEITWLPMIQRHLHRIYHDASVYSPAHGPADDLPRVKIHHHSQVQPALARPDERYVRCPDFISPGDREVLLEQIARFDHASLRGDPKAPLWTTLEPSIAHQTGYMSNCNNPATSDQNLSLTEPP